MTEALVIGGTVMLGGLVLWLAMKAAEASGRAKEQAQRANNDAANAREAAEVIAQHRTIDDAADRLQRGDF